MKTTADTFTLAGKLLRYERQEFSSIPDAEKFLGSGKVLDYINYAHNLVQRSEAASKARTLSTWKGAK